MLDDKIIMTGIDQNSQCHHNIHRQLRSLLEDAPSDASVKFKHFVEAEGNTTIMKVYSQQGKFVASLGNQTDNESTCKELCKEIRKQLVIWKSKRFQHCS